MENEREILQRDLLILEEMVTQLEVYLMSEATHWKLNKPDMPKMTIGGCLMRLDRLPQLRHKLEPEEQTRLREVMRQFDLALEEKVVRFERRTHQEIGARLGEWSNHLRGLSAHRGDVDHYADVVDTRVVIAAMIQKLQTPPYRLDGSLLEQVTTLDNNLRSRWQVGPFVWPAVWQVAYPAEKYWWLYGQPVS